jgi:uncharacterized protein (DUF2164 family)
MNLCSGVQLKFSNFLTASLVLLLFLGFAEIGFSEEEEIVAQIDQLKSRIAQLENKLGQHSQEITEIKENSSMDYLEGLSMGVGATFILQGTHNANGDILSKKGEDVTDSSYSIDLEFEKEFQNYGKAFIHLEAGGGTGVEDELKLFSNVNRDADNDENVRLTEVWYEHYLESLPLTITFGKIDATCFIDANEYANDECVQFLGRIFRNSPTIEFADNAAGIRFGLRPVEFLDIELVIMDADSNWEDVLDDIFVAGQINFKPQIFNRDANYRLISWFNDRGHTKWDDSSKTGQNGYGVGVSLDQQLSDNFGVFVRYGWQEPDRRLNGLDDDFSLEHAWSVGLQVSGTLWKRDSDIFAVAFGQAIPSDDYRDAGVALNAKSEDHLEVYYNCKINDHLMLSPDIQVVWDPYGSDAFNGDDVVIIGGLRGQVDF